MIIPFLCFEISLTTTWSILLDESYEANEILGFIHGYAGGMPGGVLLRARDEMLS